MCLCVKVCVRLCAWLHPEPLFPGMLTSVYFHAPIVFCVCVCVLTGYVPAPLSLELDCRRVSRITPLSSLHTCAGGGQEENGLCVCVCVIIEYICLRMNAVYCNDASFTMSHPLHDDTLDVQSVLLEVMTTEQRNNAPLWTTAQSTGLS